MGRTDGDVAWEKLVRAFGLSVIAVTQASSITDSQSVVLTEVRAKLHADNRTSVLLIIKATRGDDALVAFVGDSSFGGALLSLRKKLAAGSLKWREDRPWGG